MRFQGSLVAVVTPMKDGVVDLRALRELVEWQLAQGTDGLVPCGTTGEGVTLTAQERSEVVRTVVETVRGRAVVIAGAGSNATHECIESVKRVKELKADAALVVTPYYNKPTQEGLYRHYMAIREATANMDRQVQLVEKVGRDALSYLSGDDFTVLPYIACGGHGVISVVGNVAPRAMKELVSAALRGDHARALEKQVALAELNRAMFLETNPGPVKAAVALMGKAAHELRLPLAPVSDATLVRVREAMVRFGLIK